MIRQLTNIGGYKFGKDVHPDVSGFAKVVQKEFDNIRRQITTEIQALSAPTTTATVRVASISSSSSSTSTSPQIKAGVQAVGSVADTPIVFPGSAMSTSYVLTAYFLDSSGQFANLPVVQADQTATGFTVRAADLPSVGMIFYIAVAIS